DHQSAEQFTDLVAQLRAAAYVIAQGRPLATTVTLHELVGQFSQRVDGGIGVGHAGALLRVKAQVPLKLSANPDTWERISSSRLSARMCRLLAADGLIPSSRAVSSLVSISKCRSTSTSRSSAGMSLRASWTRNCVSARMAARLAEVSRPISSAASEAEEARGKGPW